MFLTSYKKFYRVKRMLRKITSAKMKKKKQKTGVVVFFRLPTRHVVQVTSPHWRVWKNMNVGFGITFVLIALSLFFAPSIGILNLEIINNILGRAKPGFSEDLVSLASLNKKKKNNA